MDQFSIFSTRTVTLLQSQQEISVDPKRCCLHWQHKQLNPGKNVFSGMYLFWFQSSRGTNADENCSSSLSTHSYLYHSIYPRLGQFVGATEPMPAEQLLSETGSSRPVLTNETQMISRYINQVLSGPVPGTALTSPWGADCTALTPQGMAVDKNISISDSVLSLPWGRDNLERLSKTGTKRHWISPAWFNSNHFGPCNVGWRVPMDYVLPIRWRNAQCHPWIPSASLKNNTNTQ